MALGRCAQCRGFVNASDAECPNCGDVQRDSGRAVVAGVTRAALAAGAVATLMACYGGPPPPSQPLYSPCGGGPGAECILGGCLRSVLNSAASFCTMTCTTTGAACPTVDGHAGVCIENGSGQCFQRCSVQSDCDPYGMTCTLANGVDRVCVPDFPGAVIPYAVCGTHGFQCALGSVCEVSSITAGAATVSHCTRECTVDADCAYQGVCAAGQCYLPCDPTRIDAGNACAGAPGPATYTCLPTPDGTRNVCVPGR